MPNTPRRSFRASDALWSAAQARAAREGDELSTILVRALLEYARDDDAPAPAYPSTREADAYQDSPGAESVDAELAEQQDCEACGALAGERCAPGCLGLAALLDHVTGDYPSTREADVELDAREAYTRRMSHDRPLAERAAAARDAYQDAPGAEPVAQVGIDVLLNRTDADYPSTREAEPAYQDAPGADEPCLCAAFPARHARSDHTRG